MQLEARERVRRAGLLLVGGEVKGSFVGSTVILVVLAAAAVNDGIR